MACYLDELKLNIKDCSSDFPYIEAQGLVQDDECESDYNESLHEYMKECDEGYNEGHDGVCSMSFHSMPSFMSHDNSSNYSGIRTDTSEYTYITMPDKEKTLTPMECYQECLKLEKKCPDQVKCKKPLEEDICYDECLRLKRLCPNLIECTPKKNKIETVNPNDNKPINTKPTNYIHDDPEEQNHDIIPNLNNMFETDTVTSFDNYTLPGHIDSEYESLIQDCSIISEQNSNDTDTSCNSCSNIQNTSTPIQNTTGETKEDDALYSECLSFKKLLEQHGCFNTIECHK